MGCIVCVVWLQYEELQYAPGGCRTAMYWSDWGLGGDPFYMVGWYINSQLAYICILVRMHEYACACILFFLQKYA